MKSTVPSGSQLTNAMAVWLRQRAEANPTWLIRERLRQASLKHQDVIDLTRGDPDLPTPPNIVEAGIVALRSGKTHYTHSAGIPQLRRAIVEDLQRRNGIPVEADGIMVTAGVMEAVTTVLCGLLDSGDEIILADPNYPGYFTAIALTGARPVTIPAGPAEGYRMPVEAIAAALTPRTKAILFVNPSNPGGATFHARDLRALAALVEERDLVVIADEIYDRYVWEEGGHTSLAALPGMASRTVTVGGFSKTYCMTGWRLGYIAGPSDFVRGLMEVRYAHGICAAEFTQWAGVKALSPVTEVHVAHILGEFRRRRDVFVEGLDRIGLLHSEVQAGYFVLVRVPAIDDGVVVAHSLVEQARLHTWPGRMFGTIIDSWVRISLVHPIPVLQAVLGRLEAWSEVHGS